MTRIPSRSLSVTSYFLNSAATALDLPAGVWRCAWFKRESGAIGWIA